MAIDMGKIVEIQYGKIEGIETDGLIKYLGIPYAVQPAGELRWKRARECAKWNGVFQAKTYGPAAIQENQGQRCGSDECLTINVVRPPEGENLPVFVWIHGGGYVCGSASDRLFHGDSFARDGIIYVNFQYRLNVLGFYDFSTYRGCELIESNRGLSDMVMALKWVHENIMAFGGNPDKVTIAGESAGAAAAVALMAVPAAKGYFQQVIAESALCNCVMTPKTLRKNMDLFLEGMGWDEDNLYEKLTKADPFDLIKGAQYQGRLHQYRNPGIFQPCPVVDDLLPERPLDAIRDGFASGIKLLIGTNLHEGIEFVKDNNTGFPNSWDMIYEMFQKNGNLDGYEAVKEYYADIEKVDKFGNAFVHFATDYAWEMPSIKAALYQSKYADTWMYRFEYITQYAKDVGTFAAHAYELPCVFKAVDHGFGKMLFGGEEEDDVRRICKDMHDSWVYFAKNGTPDPKNWPRFEGEVSPVRIFDHHTRTVVMDRASLMRVWGDMRFYEG